MGYSIAAGVAARPQAPAGWCCRRHAAGAERDAAGGRDAMEHHPVAYAQHRGRRGHPVGFARELYSELITLSGDEGARSLVARYPRMAWTSTTRCADRRRHRGRPRS
jgi:molybdenum cofactor cytidylyltransferase